MIALCKLYDVYWPVNQSVLRHCTDCITAGSFKWGGQHINVFVQFAIFLERALICFRLSFLAAAAAATLWSPLNISLII